MRDNNWQRQKVEMLEYFVIRYEHVHAKADNAALLALADWASHDIFLSASR